MMGMLMLRSSLVLIERGIGLLIISLGFVGGVGTAGRTIHEEHGRAI